MLALIVGLAVLAVALAFRLPLWVAMFSTGFVMILLGSGFSALIGVLAALARLDYFGLFVAAYLVSVLVSLYRDTGMVDRLAQGLVSALRRPRLVVMFVPAVLGVLSIPGGALMSAPVVDRVGEELGLGKAEKLFVNIWFRHLIFLVYPLSSVILVTSALADVNIWSMIIRNFPAFCVMASVGYFLVLRGKRGGASRSAFLNAREDLLVSLLPLMLAVFLSLVFQLFLGWMLPPYFLIAGGVAVGIAALAVSSKTGVRGIVGSALSKLSLEVFATTVGIVFLRIAFSVSGASSAVAEVVGSTGLGGWVLLVVLPFVFSYLTGNSLSGVAISYPILEGIIGIGISEAALLFDSAFLGYLSSPAHMCYVYTAQYLKANFTSGYKYMVPATALVLLAAVLTYVFARV